jgi:release factor glutamine methyltransferase
VRRKDVAQRTDAGYKKILLLKKPMVYVCCMTIHEARLQLTAALYEVYAHSEAETIAAMVLEKITGWQKPDRVFNKKVPLNIQQAALLQEYTDALLQSRPVQYVLQEAWFYKWPFYVNEAVLIPRPETAELVEWIYKEHFNKPATVLDIGTGSGCISICLKKLWNAATITAIDISEEALNVARKNATLLDAELTFKQIDFLAAGNWNLLPGFDIIVSNPPYIPLADKNKMQQNVLAHEPHLALFVYNEDALLFYRNIANFCNGHLNSNGAVYVETHEAYANEVADLFTATGFKEVTIKKDMQGKARMVKACQLC